MLTAVQRNGASFQELQTRTIPESYVVVRQLGTSGYAMQFEDPDKLCYVAISKTQPALLVRKTAASS